MRDKTILSFPMLLALPVALSAMPAGGAEAATIPVTNCNDGGGGSLRDGVQRAASGDTIDMRRLACRRIGLAGAIDVPQQDLALLGPGPGLVIDGNDGGSVLRHGGTGTLLLRGLSVARGHLRSSFAQGGCLWSHGNVLLQNVRVHHCTAEGDRGLDPQAAGGGIAADGDVTLVDSLVYANVAVAGSFSAGGGIVAQGRLKLVRSRLFGNSAPHGNYGGGAGFGGLTASYSEISGNDAEFYGGVFARGDSTVSHSAIVGNHALQQNGGIALGGSFATGGDGETLLVIDSTISDNTASSRSGLVLDGNAAKSVLNSTIAYNREFPAQSPTPPPCEGALYAVGLLELESTIVARNRCDDRPGDILVPEGTARLEGGDNLIEVSSLSVPPGTISANPRLAALAHNGGPTRTRALMSGSPAIDMGSNVGGVATDQRGPGFPRVKGMRADIGAFER